MDINITNPVTKEKIGEVVNGAASATPNDTDLVMSVESSVAKKNTWTQIKAFLKTYFDTVYQAAGSYLTSVNITQTITNGVTDKAPSEDAVYDALALKQDGILFKQNTTITHTGTLALTVVASFPIPLNFNQQNDFLKIWGMAGYDVTGGAVGNGQIRFYIGSNPTDITGATHVATINNTTTLRTFPISRTFVFKNSLTDFEGSATSSDFIQTDYVTNPNAPTTYSIDFSTQKYFHITNTLTNVGNVIYLRSLYAQILR